MSAMKTPSLYGKYGLPTGKLIFLFIAVSLAWTSCQDTRIDFSAEVKPIFNQKCIHCHGGVKENGGFSLITRDLALRVNDSGNPAILPGDADNSELIKRVMHANPEERMPYEEEPLEEEEIEILKRWIDQGANWDLHWAYKPVSKPRVEIATLKSSVIDNAENRSGNGMVDLFHSKEIGRRRTNHVL